MAKRIAHIFLALILMVNTMGVLLNSHYCGDYMASFAFYAEAKPCCEGEEEKGMAGCCRDEMFVLQLEEDYLKESKIQLDTAPDFTYILPEFTFLTNIFEPFEDLSSIKYHDYSPPLLTQDIPIEVQSFLL